MEFYSAYWNYKDLMVFVENMIRNLVIKNGGISIYQGKLIDFNQPFDKLTIVEAIYKYIEGSQTNNREWLVERLNDTHLQDNLSMSKLQYMVFEKEVESSLWNPTFICEHPTEVSPLARQKDDNQEITERFELYIAGRELGNGFSELNDAEEQANRFNLQVASKNEGDDEAMFYDKDFVTALEYGLPPTGGCGIGIDRLVMLLTDSASIKDVILFPTLKII